MGELCTASDCSVERLLTGARSGKAALEETDANLSDMKHRLCYTAYVYNVYA